jgi:4a-hydroxytetrahydrobiopterin dehydratase
VNPTSASTRPSRQALSDDAVAAALSDLPGWSHAGGALRAEFRFADFRTAMAFLVRAAFEAEALDHHPEWSNVYNRVEVVLRTHDAGGRVTALDVELAARFGRLAVAGGAAAR